MYGRSFSRKCAAIVIFFPYFVYSHVSSYLGARLQRWHNFKSVTPIAIFGKRDYEDLLEVTLKNVGIAPLHVKLGSIKKGTRKRGTPVIL